ncbi:MAG: META domain-containing protein [Ferruginibacter sp.]
MLKYLLPVLFYLYSSTIFAQQLKPGFDKQEFIELLKIGARTSADSNYFKKIPAPQYSTLVYQSATVGFDNLWQLWRTKDNVAVISIRGTTKTVVSFLADLYAAMAPAKGTLQLEKDFTFNYNLSDNPGSAVHVGFLIAMAYLSRDILPKIDSCYKTGTKQFIIAGHSQGGAITYMLTSYLESLKKENRLPKDIRFKTCASASPKPGNLFYAYDFENLTRDGWSYNVVNSVDWVPELPFSIQTLDDMNETNPFVFSKKLIKKQKFPLNIVLRSAYNQMSKPTKKALKNYKKWLGKRLGKFVKKSLKELTLPDYFNSNSYVRTGTTIVLVPDSSYFQKFPEVKDSIWHNHIQEPYLFLTEKLPDNDQAATQSAPTSKLSGTWQLDYIAGEKIPLDSLYPQRKPSLVFNVDKNELNGFSGCNPFSGKLNLTQNKISFTGPIAITKMSCTGSGEQIFLKTLISVNSYSVNDDGLTLVMDDMAVMHFSRM